MIFPLALIIGLVVGLIVLLCIMGYKKAPPDIAYIISGIKKEPRVAIGRATIVVPFLERLDKLSLQLIKIDVKTSESVPTTEYINVSVDAVVTVKIGLSEESIALAAKNFLNKGSAYIAAMITEVLEGNIREIVGTMRLSDMVQDRQSFAQKVQANAVPDMEKMGIEIVSFNVQSFSDENNLIVDLGIDNTTAIKKNAAIVKAESERDVRIAQAKAAEEANEAEVNSNQSIAIKQNQLELKKAELKTVEDTKKAGADAAYEIQKQIQRQTIEIKSAEADIAREEKQIEIHDKAIAIQERMLDAEIKKKADAEKYQREREAEAELIVRQKKAEAELYEIQKKAQAEKAKAEAHKFAKEQEAIGIEAVGQAEARAIEAKGKAEAEAMEKKAEAYAKYTSAAITEMIIGVLPEVAKNVAEPLSRIDNISIIGGGNGVDAVAENVPIVMARAMQTIKKATGVDVENLINAESLEAKVKKDITINKDSLPVEIKE